MRILPFSFFAYNFFIHPVAPSQLTLEITESTLMDEPERAQVVLASLRALGVSIAIDDFGTGYSSFAYLKRLPIDEVKIDKAFVFGLGADADSATLPLCGQRWRWRVPWGARW